jgi:hypothetical protein
VILIYSERELPDVGLEQVIPTCEARGPRVVPLVGEGDLQCLHSALHSASRAVVLKTGGRLWAALAREIRHDVEIYVWGAPLRGRGLAPIYPAGEYRGPGVYYVRERRELVALRGRRVEGLLLDARGFNARHVELVLSGKLKCNGGRSSLVEMLLCDAHLEVDVL